MLKKLAAAMFGIVVLASSFAFAGQSTGTTATAKKPTAATTQANGAQVQRNQTNAPAKKRTAKKHHKRQVKKQASQTAQTPQKK